MLSRSKRQLSTLVIVAVVLTLTVVSVSAQNADAPRPLSVTTGPCPVALPAGEIDGETVVCGQVEVPEDWDNPAGKSIFITYAVVKAQSQAPFSDPVIYFEGGPGSTSIEVLARYIDEYSHLRATRDVIFYDQRGNRYSARLDCPSEVRNSAPPQQIPEGVDVEALGALITNVTLDSDPAAVDEAFTTLGPLPTTVACGAYFAEQGIDLREYSTPNSIRDAMALMSALDYPNYNLYAISYGTTLVQELMRYYDENPAAALPAIRSIIIDGVIPLTANLTFNDAIATPNVVLDVFDSCAADPACSAAYPNIRQRLIDLLAAVEAQPLTVDESTTITVTDLRTVLRNGVETGDTVPYLPRLVDELERGVADVYLRLQSGTLPIASVPVVDLNNPLDSIALEADMLANQVRTIANQIDALTAQSRRLSEALQSGLTLPQAFVEELVGSAQLLGYTDQKRIGTYLSTLSRTSPDRNALAQVVNQLSEVDATVLRGLIGLLDDEDLAKVYTLLADPEYQLAPQDEILQITIHCNDRLSNYDPVQTFVALRAFAAPQLIDPADVNFGFRNECVGYGLTAPSVPAPPFVTNSSDVPVLVVNGALDKATSAMWGIAVYEQLRHARLLTFPQSNHGATLESKCAEDVTNAFFMYPDAELNLGCIDTLRPVFVTPDEALPAVSQ